MSEGAPIRDNFPTYAPPDTAAWERDHAKPYPVGRVQDAYVSRALAATRQDYSTIKREETIGAQVALDAVHDGVHADLELPDSRLVFFDPSDEQFWVYPRAKAQPIAGCCTFSLGRHSMKTREKNQCRY